MDYYYLGVHYWYDRRQKLWYYDIENKYYFEKTKDATIKMIQEYSKQKEKEEC